MAEYLALVHNNLNKGIPGRRGRKIQCLIGSPDSSAPSSPAYCNDVYYARFAGHLLPYQQIPICNLNSGYGNPSDYESDIARWNITAQASIHLDIHMGDSDAQTMGSSPVSATSPVSWGSPASMACPSSPATSVDAEVRMMVASRCGV